MDQKKRANPHGPDEEPIAMRDELLRKMQETAQRIQRRIQELLAKYDQQHDQEKPPPPDDKAE
jgi:hypothetical protein